MRKPFEFDWVPNSENAARQMYDRLVGATGAVGALCLGALLVMGKVSPRVAAVDTLLASILLVIVLLLLRSISRATVVVDDEKLALRNLAGSYEYPWADVSSFSRQPPGASRLLALLGVRDSAFLEIRLTRRSRLGFWRLSGTRAGGIRNQSSVLSYTCETWTG